MYDTATEFMRTLGAGHPVLWALLVMAVVAGASLFLSGFWEAVWRLASCKESLTKNGRRPSG